MAAPMTNALAVDCMGGDYGFDETLKGIRLFLDYSALKTYAQKLILVGDWEGTSTDLSDLEASDRVQFIQADNKTAAMKRCFDAVTEKQAFGVVSAGDTRNLTMLTRKLDMYPAFTMPALLTGIPTTRKGKYTFITDVGATLEYTHEGFLALARAAVAAYRIRYPLERVRVGMLNIGTETNKGTESLKKAQSILENIFSNDDTIDFMGFVEPSDAFTGNVDVIISDGYAGNILLKTMEATATAAAKITQNILLEGVWGKVIKSVVGIIAYPRLKKIKHIVHPDNYNGALMLGCSGGVVVKSHGSSKHKAFANAIHEAFAFHYLTQELDPILKADLAQAS